MYYRAHQIDWNSHRGVTLVELMVSMLLGIVLSGGMVSAYLTAKRSHYYEDQMARIQENGRYAMRLLSRELSMTGFRGGVPLLTAVPPGTVRGDCTDRDWVLDTTNPLELVSNHAGGSAVVTSHHTVLICLDGTSIVPNTDLIALKRTAAQASLRDGIPALNLTVSPTENWYLQVMSGREPTWEKLSANDLLDSSRALRSLSYWKAVTRIFFVRRYSEASQKSAEIPSLCMKTLAGDAMTSRCLVEGVEDMQFEFGIDRDGDGIPNQYTDAPAKIDMLHVVTVRVYLLLRSILPVTGYRDEKVYALGRKLLPARRDAYLRRTFSSTIWLRNRVEPVG